MQYCLPEHSRAYSRRATDPRRATCDTFCILGAASGVLELAYYRAAGDGWATPPESELNGTTVGQLVGL